MYQQVNKDTFIDTLTQLANFSIDGAASLFESLEDIEHETGSEIEFDPVAIRCEFCEYRSTAEAAEDMGVLRNSLEVVAEDPHCVIVRKA